MVSAWRNFKNIFSRPLFTIIFRPEMLKFQPYSILTGDTMVGFVIFCVLIHQLPLQSPGLSDQTADNSCHDDASSTGAKDDEEDDDDEDDKLEGLTGGDPEKLKAFNVSIWLQSI